MSFWRPRDAVLASHGTRFGVHGYGRYRVKFRKSESPKNPKVRKSEPAKQAPIPESPKVQSPKVQSPKVQNRRSLRKSESPPETPKVRTPAQSLLIETYREKSFVVRGDTKPFKDQLGRKGLGGKWNRKLRGGAAWIFRKFARFVRLHTWDGGQSPRYSCEKS